MKFVKKVAATAALMGLASVANAASVANTLFPGFQQLSDNSAEYLINADPNATDTTLDLGDRLVGIFTIETVEKAGNPTRFLGAGTGNNELTGIFDATVVGVFGGPGGLLSPFIYVFAPTASFESTYGAGAMVALFEDSTPDYRRVDDGVGAPDTVADLIATASDGTHVLTGSMNVPGATFWMATAVTNDISVVGSIAAPGNGGTFNLGLNFTFAAPGYNFLTVPCFNPLTGITNQVSTCGSGSLLGTGGVNTPFDSFDNVDFTVNRVPEPGSIGLLAGALIGGGLVARRSQKKR